MCGCARVEVYKGSLCVTMDGAAPCEGGIYAVRYISTPEYSRVLSSLPDMPLAVGNVFCKPKCPRNPVATAHEALSYRWILREGVIWTLISQIVGNDDRMDDTRGGLHER